jgi:hypothetical protein
MQRKMIEIKIIIERFQTAAKSMQIKKRKPINKFQRQYDISLFKPVLFRTLSCTLSTISQIAAINNIFQRLVQRLEEKINK